MNHLKTYENINKPDVEDYVIINVKHKNYYNLPVIGKIYGEYPNTFFNRIGYFIIYTLPDNHTFNDVFEADKILKFSKNKEDLEMYLTSNKYNI